MHNFRLLLSFVHCTYVLNRCLIFEGSSFSAFGLSSWSKIVHCELDKKVLPWWILIISLKWHSAANKPELTTLPLVSKIRNINRTAMQNLKGHSPNIIYTLRVVTGQMCFFLTRLLRCDTGKPVYIGCFGQAGLEPSIFASRLSKYLNSFVLTLVTFVASLSRWNFP